MTIGYRPVIFYTDTTGIRAMWTYGEILSAKEEFPNKEKAQEWIDAIKKYWLTPKMAKKVLFESSSISEVRR